MSLALLLALQAAPAAPAGTLPLDFDLARMRPADPCKEPTGSEIVICGRRRSEAYPMEAMERRYRQGPLVAEIGLGGGAKARAYLEGVEIAPGLISKRVMVGIKVPF